MSSEKNIWPVTRIFGLLFKKDKVKEIRRRHFLLEKVMALNLATCIWDASRYIKNIRCERGVGARVLDFCFVFFVYLFGVWGIKGWEPGWSLVYEKE